MAKTRRSRGLFTGLLTLLIVVVGNLLAIAYQLFRVVLVGVGGLIRGLRWTLIGRYRAVFAPPWLLGLALIPLQDVAWLWLIAACLVFGSIRPDAPAWLRREGQFLSDKERRLLCILTLALAGAENVLVGSYWWVRAAVLTGIVLSASPSWWTGRRIRPRVDLTKIQQEWNDKVVPAFPKLAGEWLDFDETKSTGVLELTTAKASEAARMDEDAEWALRRARGTVSISDDPRLQSVRKVRIAFSTPGEGGRMQYFDGPTFDGEYFLAGYGYGQNPTMARWRRPGGVTNWGVIGPPGSGKGLFARLAGVEAALMPDSLLLGVDGKGGAGIGSLRTGCYKYATTPQEWSALVDWVYRVTKNREARYGKEQWEFYTAQRPLEPHLILWIDESNSVFLEMPQLKAKILYITAKGRSLGVSVAMSTQYGNEQGYGNTNIRGNMLGNGSLWAGPTSDVIGRQLMLQDFKINLSSLPAEPGWAFIQSKLDAMAQTVPMRGLVIPSQQEVDFGMFDNPFGTVQDWMTRAAFPQMHPSDIEAGSSAAVIGGPDDGAAAPAPVLDLKPDSEGKAKIRRVLTESEIPLPRGAIAERAGVVPRHAQDLLKELKVEGFAYHDEDKGLWEKIPSS